VWIAGQVTRGAALEEVGVGGGRGQPLEGAHLEGEAVPAGWGLLFTVTVKVA
jgi:hypothetical protein